jgi:hypothetical protein
VHPSSLRQQASFKHLSKDRSLSEVNKNPKVFSYSWYCSNLVVSEHKAWSTIQKIVIHKINQTNSRRGAVFLPCVLTLWGERQGKGWGFMCCRLHLLSSRLALRSICRQRGGKKREKEANRGEHHGRHDRATGSGRLASRDGISCAETAEAEQPVIDVDRSPDRD